MTTDIGLRRGCPHPPGPVIFDCDGTLVATEGLWDGAYTILFDRYQTMLSRPDRHRLVGLTLGDLGREISRLIGQPHRHRELATEVLDLVSNNLGRGVAAMPGAVELVTALARTRPIGVASNTLRSAVVEYLTQIGIGRLVDVVVCSDDVAAPKPAPDVYLTACARLGFNPGAAVAIEDSAAGAHAAHTAGLYVIGVPSQPDLLLPAADVVYPSLNDPGLRQILTAGGSIVRRTAM
ncbi:HAD superfamily hydrolase (TIGR01509 family) [Micromonospora sp. Llam0]|uniref:HAD family hydrolase n=1 Tax=Micromonospora sp. Llam0 TaxID=2485143 RepID=UPI000FB45F17|nr:HAD family phosphatase [Micromonospora sp. Llam0]ROO50787.1 HAD superfamily hydrolase (TIGR01509 family) [Micromonospora sp. Llam0]